MERTEPQLVFDQGGGGHREIGVAKGGQAVALAFRFGPLFLPEEQFGGVGRQALSGKDIALGTRLLTVSAVKLPGGFQGSGCIGEVTLPELTVGQIVEDDGLITQVAFVAGNGLPKRLIGEGELVDLTVAAA